MEELLRHKHRNKRANRTHTMMEKQNRHTSKYTRRKSDGILPLVLLDVVEVVSTNDTGAFHLHLQYHPSQDPAPNGYIAREGTLLVYVGALNGLKDWANRRWLIESDGGRQ